LTCTRSDVLGAGASYPPITLTVTVSASAVSPLVNIATVSGGSDTNPTNNTATDSVILGASPIPTLSGAAQAIFVLVLVVGGLLALHRRRAAAR
jgi:hypothetical protein